MRAEAVKLKALDLGFNLVGIIPAHPSPMLDAYLRWIEAGMQGEMHYLARADRVERRRSLNVILPGVESMIIVGLDYRTGAVPPAVLTDPSRGRIAAYAWGVDYHDIMTPRLEIFAEWLRAEYGILGHQRVYVDTGPILERSHAQQAGLGFIGKNTMLIHPRRGSDFFIGEILTTLSFDQYDQAQRETMCGRCRRCLSACPTDAFPAPYVLDARRCISYHTIENKGWIDRDLRAQFGNWIFGCDICQEVCPFQRFAPNTAEKTFFPVDADRAAPPLIDLLRLDDSTFQQRYHGTVIFRIKRERLVRNTCIAAGNSGDQNLAAPLIHLLNDPSPLVRGHAAWGLKRLAGSDAHPNLKARLQSEDHPQVLSEIYAALSF